MNTILMFGKDDDIPDMGGVSKKSELFGGGVHEYNSHVWKRLDKLLIFEYSFLFCNVVVVVVVVVVVRTWSLEEMIVADKNPQ